MSHEGGELSEEPDDILLVGGWTRIPGNASTLKPYDWCNVVFNNMTDWTGGEHHDPCIYMDSTHILGAEYVWVSRNEYTDIKRYNFRSGSRLGSHSVVLLPIILECGIWQVLQPKRRTRQLPWFSSFFLLVLLQLELHAESRIRENVYLLQSDVRILEFTPHCKKQNSWIYASPQKDFDRYR